ncbi:PF06155 family protein [Leptospira weilii serovar Topaz str. LT2116]|uniref:PF06155 family protein n=1 Tax=Leptospira weilii serovar Topaz str. LT2116 TaxID=1088540 RepID=M3H3K8_9LEPT|nr:PF06155 family protein [Leptospira weilii serovar Topaz str. LT2116]
MRLSLKATTPDQIDFDENYLKITWKDGVISVFDLLDLRKRCPCVVCKGGHGGKVGTTTGAIQSIRLYSINKVGRYAINPIWSDNHQTGIYSYDSLRMFADGLGGELVKEG